MSAPSRQHADDELFAPSLGHRRHRPTGSDRPWRLSSQVYVAFLGGALAVTPIAAGNAYKLGLPKSRIVAIVAIGIASFAAAVTVAVVTGSSAAAALTRLCALAGYGGMYLIQRQADRVYSFGQDDEEAYESLWGPGVVVTIAGYLMQSFVIAGFQVES